MAMAETVKCDGCVREGCSCFHPPTDPKHPGRHKPGCEQAKGG